MPPPQPRAWRIVHSEASLGWGGQEHRILAELTGFQRRGARVWLLAAPASGVAQRARQAGVEVLPLNTNRWLYPVNAVRLARWLRRERVEVLNPHSSRDGWLLGIAGRLAKVPLVLRSRHFDVPIPNRQVSGFVYRRLADHVLTTSPRITAHFREYFQLPAERVSTLPTGIDLAVFSPQGEASQLVPPTLPARPLIGIVSVIRKAKGHGTLLEAARRLRDGGWEGRYVFVGEGPYRPTVEAQVRSLGLEDCVAFTGHREDVPAVLRALNLLAIPSLHEGIPQIGLQALASQTPVVASAVGGLPSIIRPGQTGRLVPPEDPVALAAALRETLAQPEVTRAYCLAGRALVERGHSLEGMLDQLEVLYRRYIPSATAIP